MEEKYFVIRDVNVNAKLNCFADDSQYQLFMVIFEAIIISNLRKYQLN